MKLSMLFKEYLNALKDKSNQELTLHDLTLPFGISTDPTPSPCLLIGHVLDELTEKLSPDQFIDCIDVATAAFDLGHDQAGLFLDEAPLIMYRIAQDAKENPVIH